MNLLFGNTRKTSQHQLHQNTCCAEEWCDFNEEVKLICESLPKQDAQINPHDDNANTEKETM